MTKYLTAAAVTLTLASAGCSIDVRGEEMVFHDEKRFTVTEPLELVLSTFDGAIEVRSWDRNEVLVQIARRAASAAEAKALEVRTTQEGGRLVVEAPSPSRNGERDVIHIGSWRSPSVSFVITTPRRVSVEARTGDGPIAAAGLMGQLALHTGDGAVRVERVEGNLLVNTGDGPVTVSDLRGGLDLNTGDGGVEVTGRLSALRLHTGDGPIRLEAQTGTQMTGEWTVSTGDGAITVRVPPDFSAELDAFSGDGRITVEGLGTATPSRDDDQPAQLRTSLGKGGSTFHLRTGDGPIRVAR